MGLAAIRDEHKVMCCPLCVPHNGKWTLEFGEKEDRAGRTTLQCTLGQYRVTGLLRHHSLTCSVPQGK